jgi:hypothetical protein
MAVSQEAPEVISRVDTAFSTGLFTKRVFVGSWRELEKLLGDGEEAEAIEALTIYAQEDWLEELDVTES